MGRAVQPTRTSRGAVSAAGLVVSTEEAVGWVGGDASQHNMIEQMLMMAQEETAAYMGIKLETATVTDYYPAWMIGDRLVASARYTSVPTVKIMSITARESVIATSEYKVDRTGEKPAIVVCAASKQANELYENPVSVAYQTGIADYPERINRFKNAVLTRTGILFESRGTMPPRGWERAWATTMPLVL